MRNPIQPSPDRPIPLPDCILLDAWWADRPRSWRDREDSALRLVVIGREEDQHDRHRAGGDSR